MYRTTDKDYELVIKPSNGIFNLNLHEVWAYRELLFFLVWRDIKIKYKQSFLGVGWAVFQPVISMVVFTLIFGKIAKMPSGGVPYPVFTLCGVVIWNYFSSSITGGTSSLINSRNLITKVYFPRLIIPLAAVGTGILDCLIGFGILFLMILYFGIMPSVNILFAPIFIILSFMAAGSISLWTSAVSVKYRDIPKTIPFLVRMLFWVTPVAYGAEAIPEKFAFLYALNPMYSIIEGFRWSLLNTPFPSVYPMSISLVMVFIFFIGGIVYFKNMEREFADLI